MDMPNAAHAALQAAMLAYCATIPLPEELPEMPAWVRPFYERATPPEDRLDILLTVLEDFAALQEMLTSDMRRLWKAEDAATPSAALLDAVRATLQWACADFGLAAFAESKERGDLDRINNALT